MHRVQKKLDRWKRFNFSHGGRATLCKLVLSNLPIYYVFVSYAIKGHLHWVLKDFFWEGNKGSRINHLAKWDLVSRSLMDGGLGFDDIKVWNVALLAKWGWRYFYEANSLWHMVINSIHGKGGFSWHTSGCLDLASEVLRLEFPNLGCKLNHWSVFKLWYWDRNWFLVWCLVWCFAFKSEVLWFI